MMRSSIFKGLAWVALGTMVGACPTPRASPPPSSGASTSQPANDYCAFVRARDNCWVRLLANVTLCLQRGMDKGVVSSDGASCRDGEISVTMPTASESGALATHWNGHIEASGSTCLTFAIQGHIGSTKATPKVFVGDRAELTDATGRSVVVATGDGAFMRVTCDGVTHVMTNEVPETFTCHQQVEDAPAVTAQVSPGLALMRLRGLRLAGVPHGALIECRTGL